MQFNIGFDPDQELPKLLWARVYNCTGPPAPVRGSTRHSRCSSSSNGNMRKPASAPPALGVAAAGVSPRESVKGHRRAHVLVALPLGALSQSASCSAQGCAEGLDHRAPDGRALAWPRYLGTLLCSSLDFNQIALQRGLAVLTLAKMLLANP